LLLIPDTLALASSVDSEMNEPVLPGSIVARSVPALAPDEGAYFVPYLLKNGMFIDL
jgi:hypothetical protein